MEQYPFCYRYRSFQVVVVNSVYEVFSAYFGEKVDQREEVQGDAVNGPFKGDSMYSTDTPSQVPVVQYVKWRGAYRLLLLLWSGIRSFGLINND